jgi:hypothetical protein
VWWHISIIPAFGKWSQEDQGGLRPAWIPRKVLSQNKIPNLTVIIIIIIIMIKVASTPENCKTESQWKCGLWDQHTWA